MSESDWKGKHYSCFRNEQCEFYPCHAGVSSEQFNCLFCYCPLYVLGTDCGGNPTILEDGTMDCSKCVRPHIRDNYGEIMKQVKEIDFCKKSL